MSPLLLQVGGCLPGGISVQGVSGGECKRLGIATGIIGTPSIIFLDEPTTGLDSFAALKVMKHMRALADEGHTVIVTIHQPRAAIWQLFDKVRSQRMADVVYVGAFDCLKSRSQFISIVVRAVVG